MSGDVTTPPRPYPSSNKPSALSSPPPLSDRNPCSCFGWDRAHTAVLAPPVVEVAVVLAVVIAIAIATLELVVALTKLTFGADVVGVR